MFVAHGTRGEFAATEAEFAPVPANWTVQAFDAGAMPHFECTEAFNAAYRAFLDRVSGASMAPERADADAPQPF